MLSIFVTRAGRQHSILERYIDQELLASDIHHIAKCAVTATNEVESHTALSNLQISELQMIEKIGKHRVYDVQLLTLGAWTYA